MAHPPDIRSDNRTRAASASIRATGVPSLMLDRTTRSRSARAEGTSSHQPVKWDVLSDTKIDGQALQMGPEFAVPQDGKVELRHLGQGREKGGVVLDRDEPSHRPGQRDVTRQREGRSKSSRAATRAANLEQRPQVETEGNDVVLLLGAYAQVEQLVPHLGAHGD